MPEKSEEQNSISQANFLKSILDTAMDGIMTFESLRDDSGKIVDFKWIFSNEVAAAIVGKSADQLIGEKLLEIMPANKDSGLFDKYVQVVETGQEISFEQYYVDNDLDKWFKISAVKLGDGFTVTFQDITVAKLNLAELEAKSERYRKLFDESIDAIFLVNESFDFVEANASFQELFGLSWVQLQNLSLHYFFQSNAVFNEFKTALQNQGKVEEFELDLINAGEEQKNCLINSVAIDDGETKSYLGVIRDMTKRRQAEKQLLLAEKLSMSGKIARTIGHEIRNPLTNLSLAIEQLSDEIGDLNEEAEVYINIAQRNVKRIGKLISDLLQSSKPKELALEKQSLNDLTMESVNLVRDRLKLQKIKLIEHYKDNLPEVPLDNDQFKIALLNILINAIEAMEPSKGVLKLVTDYGDGEIELLISDNGEGISEPDLDRLFEPYFSGKKEGTGLGLTTVQNIIHSHEGRIDVRSSVGEGTTFRIVFQLGSY
jgi:PAS domain S-box-containing protein